MALLCRFQEVSYCIDMRYKTAENNKRIFIFNQGGGLLIPELIKACDNFQIFALAPDEGHKFHNNVFLVNAPRFCNKSVLQRLISWVRYFFAALKIVMLVKPNDLVILSTNPPIMQVLIPILKMKRARVIYWVLDLYPDALWCGLNMSKNSVTPLIWSFVNRITFRSADFLVSLSESMCNALSKYMRETDLKKIVKIPTWVDTNKFRPVNRVDNEIARQLGLSDKFVVIYSGNIGATHYLTFLPMLAQKLVVHKNIRFLIVGRGSGLSELQKSCEGLENIVFLPPQPIEKLCETMSIGHIAIVSQGKLTGSVSMPSKTYYYMACGCAILGVVPPDSGVSDVVKKYDCGICFSPEQVPLIADFIVKLMNNSNLLSRYSENSIKAVEREFSSIVCLRSFTRLLEILSDSSYKKAQSNNDEEIV